MSDQTDEKILDSCLEEVLGGRCPPNLTPQILRAFDQLQQELGQGRSLGERSSEVPQGDRPAIVVRPHEPSGTSPATTARNWGSIAIAMGIVATGVGLGLIALNWIRPAERSPLPQIAQDAAPALDLPVDRLDPEAVEEAVASDPVEAAPDFGAGSPVDAIVEAAPGPQDLVAPLADDQIVALLDQQMRAGWSRAELQPAESIPDRQWCDRTFKRLIGRSPTASEVAAYSAEPVDSRRSMLVERLCSDPEYTTAFARHWGELWAGTLIGGGRAAEQTQRPLLRQHLEASFVAGRSLAEITETLITAEGDAATSQGAASFLLAGYGGQANAIAGHTSRIFLGQRFECAQCHDHPTDSQISQRSYWEWNAFFRLLTVDGSGDAARLVENRESGSGSTGPIFFDTPAGELKAAYPAFPGSSASQQLRMAGPARRSELAETLVKSTAFRTAVANRIWSMMFGYGFTVPVDDMGPHNEPAQPAALSLISEQLAAHDFQLAAIVQWIARSEAFGLAGDLQGGISADRPELGTKPAFARYYEQPIARPLDELLVALQPDRAMRPEASTTARLAPIGPPTGEEGLAAPSVVVPSVSLRVARSVHSGPAPLTASILDSDLTQESKLSHLYSVLLHRAPRKAERQAIGKLLSEVEPGLEREMWLDIWWALTQSDEYQR